MFIRVYKKSSKWDVLLYVTFELKITRPVTSGLG